MRSYPALDLAAAVAAAKAGSYSLAPVVANGYVFAGLDSVTTADGAAVGLDGLNTTGLVCFQDGNFLSNLYVCFENLGGTAGSVEVTGTATIKSHVYSIENGQLSFTDTDISSVSLSGSYGTVSPGEMVRIPLSITGERAQDP